MNQSITSPLYIAFSTQKGGMGKSAITTLVASYFQYVANYRVAIIDCDYPQYSIHKMRERDTRLTLKNSHYKKLAYQQLVENKKPFYPVQMSTPMDAMDVAEKLIAENAEPLQFIFFDLPGTLNTTGMIKTLAQMHYIFSPISADRMVLESTLEFATLFKEKIINTGMGNIKELFLLWNLVDAREKSDLYSIYEQAINDLGFTVLQTRLPDSKRFRHEQPDIRGKIFRSTLFSVDKKLLKGSHVDLLSLEILHLLNTRKHEEE